MNNALEIDTSRNNQFLYSNNAESLQNLAYLETALQLWREYCLTRCDLNMPTIDLKDLFSIKLIDLNSAIDNLRLPSKIRKILVEAVNWIKQEINVWLELNDHHYEISPIFFEPFVLFTRLEDLIWNPIDLTVNHEKSARNILQKSPEFLHPSQIFVAACSYCFEDFIFEFKFPEWQNLVLTSADVFRRDILQYWIDRHRYDSHFDDRAVSFFCFIPIRNTSAYQYFWNTFCEESQITLISYLISENNFCRLQYVFSSLSEMQWVRVIQADGAGLMKGLLRGCMRKEHILQVWRYINVWFNENQFIELMSFDLPSRVNCCKPNENCIHKSLWIGASDSLKRSTFHRLEGLVGFLKT